MGIFNSKDLEGKHVVITGASSGIGRAACIEASENGAVVSLIARNEEELNNTLSMMKGEGHREYVFDLTSIDEIEQLVNEIVKNQGPIDGFVHCAGIGINRPIKLNTKDFIESNMNIHFYSFAELVRIISKKKFSNEGASLIGISSVASIKGNKAQGAYSAAKGAMNAIVHSYAKELSPRGIRINTIAFGMVETGLYQYFTDTGGDNDELLKSQFLGVIPVEYAAKIICFMLGDVSKYISGGTLYYDAGMLS